MDSFTKAIANGATIAVTDMVMFGQPSSSAIYDGVALAGATVAASFINPTADTLVPQGMNDITNIAISGALYATIDSFVTNASPFSGFLPSAMWGIANISLGSNTVYPIVAMSSL